MIALVALWLPWVNHPKPKATTLKNDCPLGSLLDSLAKTNLPTRVPSKTTRPFFRVRTARRATADTRSSKLAGGAGLRQIQVGRLEWIQLGLSRSDGAGEGGLHAPGFPIADTPSHQHNLSCRKLSMFQETDIPVHGVFLVLRHSNGG